MANKHRLVDDAVQALISRALPGVKVRALGPEDAKPETVGPLGEAIVRYADPGTPDIDFSPPTYNYDRTIPIELAAYQSSTKTWMAVVDDMLAAIWAQIVADRTLGGLCTWLDAEAAVDGDADQHGTRPIGWSDFSIIASYSTSSPLG